MSRQFDWVLGYIKFYIKFFLVYLGFTFLVQELWNWFEGDSLLRNAIGVTVAVMLVNLCRLLYKKVWWKL